MSDKKTTEPKSVSINLDGEAGEWFADVKAEMVDKLPGLTPTNADVARHALYLAASNINIDLSGMVSALDNFAEATKNMIESQEDDGFFPTLPGEPPSAETEEEPDEEVKH